MLFELRRLAEACAPPWILRVAPPKARVLPVGGSNGYTMVTPARTGGALLLRPNQLVLRRQPENAREQAEARKLLRNFLRTPSFRLVGDGAFVEEEFLDGRLLLDLPADSWEPTLEQLLSCYVEAGPRYDRGSSEEAIRQALERLDRLPRAAVPQGWMDTVSRQRDGLLKRSRSWPLTPSHGDLLPGNVILTADGPAAIDLEYAGWLPFYFDAFRLLIESAARSAEPDVAALHTWWRRDRLHALFTLRGLRLEDERALALLGYVALTAYLYGGGEEGGDDAVARMLTFQWRRLAHLLEDTGTRP